LTHNDLLALIEDGIEVCSPDCSKHQRSNAPWAALRAVVELHKPDENNQCFECEYYWIDEIKFCDYPCHTIQLIEKELS